MYSSALACTGQHSLSFFSHSFYFLFLKCFSSWDGTWTIYANGHLVVSYHSIFYSIYWRGVFVGTLLLQVHLSIAQFFCTSVSMRHSPFSMIVRIRACRMLGFCEAM